MNLMLYKVNYFIWNHSVYMFPWIDMKKSIYIKNSVKKKV